jgi:hypothetical protein
MASSKQQQPTMADLLNEVAALHRKVDELMSANKAPTGSGASKARKPKDPDAPPKAPNAWIVFTGKVRATLKAAGKPAGKEAQQFASHLKASVPEAYEMEPEAILEAHEGWEAPAPKPKPEAAEEEPKPKPKRTLSEAQKAAMAEGRRKAAAARKAAEAAAKAAKDEDEDEGEDEELEEVADAKPPAPKAAPPPAPALKAYPFKGKRYLLDEASRGMWHREADGSKGAWAGRLSEDKKSLDASAAE